MILYTIFGCTMLYDFLEKLMKINIFERFKYR